MATSIVEAFTTLFSETGQTSSSNFRWNSSQFLVDCLIPFFKGFGVVLIQILHYNLRDVNNFKHTFTD